MGAAGCVGEFQGMTSMKRLSVKTSSGSNALTHILITCIVLTLLWIAAYFLFVRGFGATIYDDISVVGSSVSLVALLITLCQIIKTKSVVEQTKDAVSLARKQIDTVLTVSDMSKIAEYVRFINRCLLDEKYEIAHLRLCDVKDFMVTVPSMTNVQYNSKDYKRLYDLVESDLDYINQRILNMVDIDTVTISKDLESVVSFVNSLASKIKSNV